jgi:uncharacterized protein YcfJ
MNRKLIAALLACGAATAAIPAAAEVVLFGRDGFEGRSVELRGPQPDLREHNFNDRATSAIVYRRAWEVCEHVNFRNCRILEPGRYADLRAMGMNNGISSLRPIRQGVRYERDRYAPAPAYPVYDARRRRDERLFEADVVAVREVYGRPEQRCWVERQQVADSSPLPRSGNEIGGALIGGILGGVLGHQVGSGRGNDLATGVGAVAGALAGANVARNQSGGTGVYTQDVRRCENVRMSGAPEYYDVTYVFRGQEHRMQTTSPPPRTITVNGRGEPRVG